MDEGLVAGEAIRGRGRQTGRRPSVSIVVLSMGQESELERALAYLKGATRSMSAELIAVRAEHEERARDRVSAMARAWDCVVHCVASEESRSALIDAGMRLAAGDIVVVREDSLCLELDWLRPFAEHEGGEFHRRSEHAAPGRRLPAATVSGTRDAISTGLV